MKKIQLIIIEDNRLMRQGICEMLKKDPDIRVIEAISDIVFDKDKISLLKANVVLIDLSITNHDSFNLVKSLKPLYPNLKVIVMDLIPDQDDILRYVDAGVSGFILKDATVTEFINTIRLVANGEKVLPTTMAGSLFSQITDFGIKKLGPSKLIKSVKMTKREFEVIELIAQGLPNKEIAVKLNLSVFTVKSHVHNILEKMSLNSRIQIAIHSQK